MVTHTAASWHVLLSLRTSTKLFVLDNCSTFLLMFLRHWIIDLWWAWLQASDYRVLLLRTKHRAVHFIEPNCMVQAILGQDCSLSIQIASMIFNTYSKSVLLAMFYLAVYLILDLSKRRITQFKVNTQVERENCIITHFLLHLHHAVLKSHGARNIVYLLANNI